MFCFNKVFFGGPIWSSVCKQLPPRNHAVIGGFTHICDHGIGLFDIYIYMNEGWDYWIYPSKKPSGHIKSDGNLWLCPLEMIHFSEEERPKTMSHAPNPSISFPRNCWVHDPLCLVKNHHFLVLQNSKPCVLLVKSQFLFMIPSKIPMLLFLDLQLLYHFQALSHL